MEQVALYERRLEEGYDLHGPDYTQWLQLEHPDAVPRDYSQRVSVESVSTAIPTLSISDEFIDVLPLDPVSSLTILPLTFSAVNLTSTPTSSTTKNGSDSLAPVTIKNFYYTPSTRENGSHPTTSSSSTPSILEGRCNAIPSTSGLQEVPRTPSMSSGSHTKPSASPLTNYLIKPVIPERKSFQREAGARVLTNEDSVRLLEQKALKKQKEQEEKEQRKKDREWRQQKKAEDMQRKAEARERKKREREEEKKQHEEQKKQRDKQKKQCEETRRQNQPKQRQCAQDSETANSNPVAGLDQSQETGSQVQPRSKRARITEDTVIDTNTCCICYEPYEDDVKEANGREWIESSCG